MSKAESHHILSLQGPIQTVPRRPTLCTSEKIAGQPVTARRLTLAQKITVLDKCPIRQRADPIAGLQGRMTFSRADHFRAGTQVALSEAVTPGEAVTNSLDLCYFLRLSFGLSGAAAQTFQRFKDMVCRIRFYTRIFR